MLFDVSKIVPTAGGLEVKVINHEYGSPHPTEYREEHKCETFPLTPDRPRPEGVDYCGQKSLQNDTRHEI